MSKKIGFPTAHTIILCIAAFVALLTYIVPAGQYDKLKYDEDAKVFIRTGQSADQKLPANQATLDELAIQVPIEKFTSGDIYKPVGIPNTYQKLDSNPQNFWQLIASPFNGMTHAIDVILLVLFIGGFIGIVSYSGAFDAGIGWLAIALEGRETWLIIIVMCLIALGGTTFGLAEETIAFLPILIPVFMAAKYDALVAVAAIFLGSSIGTMASTSNPFSTIIASNAAGINWTSGLEGRFFILIGSLVIATWYLIRYANKVKNDPSQSLIYDQKEVLEKKFLIDQSKASDEFTLPIRLILLVFLLSFVIMIYGVINLEWWFAEMATTFLVGAVICGFIGRINEKTFVTTFVKGASDLLGVAMIIGLARGVTVLMDEGLISDTLLFNASNLVEHMPQSIFVNVMLFLFAGLSFFIPSSSGMAVLTMPIMAPLADVVGLPREMIVDTYTFGPGLFHFINPTGLILPSLVIANIGFNKWFKFILPLFFIIGIFIMAFLTIRVLLGWY